MYRIFNIILRHLILKKLSFDTKLVHADRKLNSPQFGGVHEATNNSVLFEFKDVSDLESVFQGKKAGHVYSRSSSSTVVSLQNMLNELDGGVGAVCFATGMAAISSTLLSLLKANDHIVVSQYLFGNTRSYMETLELLGIQISFVDITNVEDVKQAIQDNTKLVFCETIANPVTQVADLIGIGDLCESNDLLFVLDNTMTPNAIFDAHSVKASMLITSLTKYIAGHGNVLGGVTVDLGNFDWAKYTNISDKYRVADTQQWGLTQIRKRGLRDMGATLAPSSAAQVSVGLETLSMRLEKTCSNALTLANYLQNHEQIERVFYPGLPQHPQHERASSLFKDGMFGGIVSFTLKSNINMRDFFNKLALVISATHLGDTRTLALPVATTIFYENGLAERQKMGIDEQLIRISVGIEDITDLINDFQQALC